MRALLAVLLAATFLAPLTGADHAQTFGGKTATFDHRGGNDWWVEVRMGGSSLSKVEAQDTGDAAWRPMTLRSWGNWAASFHIEPGHDVRFRATFSDGTTGISCWFAHPSGTERCDDDPRPGTFTAAFSGVKGNTWWEEARVSVTGGTLAGVDVRMNGGTWKPLSLKSWGAWAASYNAPDGTIVQFRARSTGGAEALSGCYRWTAATATTCSTTPSNQWPKEGSFVKYHASYGTGVPGYFDNTEVNVTLTYKSGRWEARCEGTYEEQVGDDDDVFAYTFDHFDTKAAFDPPRAYEHDGLVRGYGVEVCFRSEIEEYAPANITSEPRVYTKNGAPVTVNAKVATFDDGCCHASHTEWHPGLGLILSAGWGGLHSGFVMDLLDTDAPIAATDPAPTPPPAPAWPKSGSFVKYYGTIDFGSGVSHENATWTYSGGRWTLKCTQHTVYRDGRPSGEDWRYEETDAMLPRGPVNGVAAGDRVWVPTGCGAFTDITKLRYSTTEKTFRNGQAVSTSAWQSDEDPDGVGDDDAWWHKGTGLVLRWEYDTFDDPDQAFSKGRLVDTDAPL